MSLLHPSVATFESDRSWCFELSSDELWDRLTNVSDYETWWPWLQHFRPSGGFDVGARWACTVSPPVPYDVRFSVLIEDVQPATSVRARVVGDIEGDAELALVDDGGGCTARLRSHLAPANRMLCGVGVAARPLVEWSHDWVLDQGQRQFLAGLEA